MRSWLDSEEALPVVELVGLWEETSLRKPSWKKWHMHWPLNFSSSVKNSWLMTLQEGQASKDTLSDDILLLAMSLASACP